jgi:Fibrinogen beta and gamma chains, C-terminal globular domain
MFEIPCSVEYVVFFMSARADEGCGKLIQQHYAGSGSPFNKDWNTFKAGFRDDQGNFWIGNDQLHEITSGGRCRLRIDLQSKTNLQWYWAEYTKFTVDDETNDYRLNIGRYLGPTQAYGEHEDMCQLF